eukprot:scaffold27829_cov119-Isochrysis_galbana.AAC.2
MASVMPQVAAASRPGPGETGGVNASESGLDQRARRNCVLAAPGTSFGIVADKMPAATVSCAARAGPAGGLRFGAPPRAS